MKTCIVILLIAVLSWSCAQKNQDAEHSHDGHQDHAAAESARGPVADLEQQVMAVHDSVMPQMSDLMRFKKQVSAKVAQTKEKSAKEEGIAISRRLNEADQAMMNWMHQYNGDTLGKLDQAKAIDYLKDQKTKVNEVRDQMRKSLTDAKNYLQ